MRRSFINIKVLWLRFVMASIILLIIIGVPTIMLFVLPDTVVASPLSQSNQVSMTHNSQIPSPSTLQPSPTVPSNGSSSSEQNSQMQQLITEAQNDISAANTIIYWTSFIFAVIVGIVTVAAGTASFLGVRQFRDLFRDYRRVQNDISVQTQEMTNHIQQITTLEKQVEDQLEQLPKRIKSELQAVEDQLKQFTDRFKDQSQSVEERFKQLTKYTEIQSILEASYDYNIAEDAYKVGNNRRAIEYYLRVLKLQPNNTRVMERLGRAYSNINDSKNAVEYLEKALTIDPSYEPALRSLALSYRYREKDKAIEYLERTLKVNPSDYEASDLLGLLYRDKGLIDNAISAHEKAFSIEQRPETEFYLSILYAVKGNKKRAQLMASMADDDLNKEEHAERIRPVWKILIHCGVYIMNNDEKEALRLIQSLTSYITTKRIYDAITAHLQFLLEGTDHKEWIPEFMDIVKLKEM